ncbi:PEP-CTERM sorting domain-containing protein [Verrucomicrobiaceae bacterium N1E253]|uniref:PEP-CTERM sorting domain-containing protein n=1 Tax=Oceaniferula marina TaxID=2748318 RepID=A0A851GQN5_9BACT|nr:PEP-CTERM sorting domain-containing protein [Oceaniferula marina]NWK57130.1 PEP-CTERM sorting domain-containing protein [Oceaniferula marina]
MKKILLKTLLFAAGASGVSATTTLATYIDGADYADTNTPAASSDASITASVMSFESLSGGFGGPVRDTFGDVPVGGAGDSSFWYIINANQDLSSDPGAASAVASDYFGFMVTVDAGSAINATALTFDWGIGNNDGTVTGAILGWRAFASVDGGAFTSVGTSEVTTDVVTKTWLGQTSANLDLAGLATTGDGGNIEIRIQQWTSSSSGGLHNSYQNLTIHGDIQAVPEPSSAALLGLGGLALIMRRRK